MVTGAGGSTVEVTGIKVSLKSTLMMDTMDQFDPIKMAYYISVILSLYVNALNCFARLYYKQEASIK
jgi:hypothetical protein